jgi:translocator protein
MTQLRSLGLFVLAVAVTASAGGVFRPDEWYRALSKPDWTPPDWAFPVVWTTLYLLLATASWLVWRKAGWGAKGTFGLFALNLALNASWSFVFFGQRQIGWALVVALGLLASTAALAWTYGRVRPIAGAMIAPYVAWVSVAVALNGTILAMN